jgi:glutamyl-tRNA synthetase
MALWKQMLEGTPHILRLKGDMKSPDSQMRDPILFRVVKSPHPIQEDTYVVWPTYDFACAIEDAVLGITHVLRSNEFHTTLQNHIRALLGLRDPIIIQYSRFNVKGSPASKRKLRPLIKENLVKGWDDIRLTTLLALERRGIVPETIHALAVEMGLSTSEPIIDWSIIEALNRKIIDPTAHRYFFVPDPVKLTVENAPEMTVRLRLHPDHDYGFRTIKTTKTFYIPRDEVTDHFRLKDLYNVAIIDINDRGDDYRGEYTGKKMKREIEKIQWVAEKNVPVTVEIPHELFVDGEFNPQSLEIVEGVAEEAVGDLSIGDIIQFERFGFCRIDALDGKVRVCYAHR